jgi:hypothetical protein
MTTLAAKKRRERTNTGRKTPSQTFNPPGGIYRPVFGKAIIFISGHGQPGNAPANPSVAYYNPNTGGNVAGYNATIPGNISGYNPPQPGNYAGTYEPGGGNLAGYNPSTGGNLSGYNPTVPGAAAYNPPQPGQIVYTEFGGPNPPAPTTYESAYFTISPFSFYNNSNGNYGNVNVDRPSGFYVSGNRYYTPGTGGNANYNPGVPGNANYNPYNEGYDYYNPTQPGSANYNPGSGGTANYNPVVPGNAVYNNYIAGVAGSPFNALGVAFPGGAIGTPAPTIGRTMVEVAYTASGVPITMPPASVVVIEET